MIPMQYHQFAQLVHQERIQAALRPRPEWDSPARSRPAPRSPLAWSRTKLLARLVAPLRLRESARPV
jgi:hypothetical protein